MKQFLSSNYQQAMPAPVAIEESIVRMKTLLLKKIKRSAYVYRVDCGGLQWL